MKNNFFFISLLLLMFSCKKEETTSPIVTSNNSNTIYGKLEAIKPMLLYFVGNDSLAEFGSTSTLANASFSSQGFINNGYLSGSDLNGGIVSLNGTTLKQQQNPIYYYDTTYAISFPIQTWNVTGSGSVPAISYTNNDSVPIYTGYFSIPDTIYKSQGFTMPITGLSDCDDFRLYMSNSSGNIITDYLSPSSNITVNPSQLANFSQGNVVFQLTFSKNNHQVFNNKTFRFKTSLLVQVSNMVVMP